MKGFLASVGVMSALSLSGCASPLVGYHSEECEFMLPTERDRCVRVNESNENAVAERFSREQETREKGRADYPHPKQPVAEQTKSLSPRLSAEDP